MCGKDLMRHVLPVSWHGIMSGIEATSHQLHHMDHWLQSHHTESPCWVQLLSALKSLQVAPHQHTLDIKPMLFHLPSQQQTILLAFIYQHRLNISLTSLIQFVTEIDNFLQQECANVQYNRLQENPKPSSHNPVTSSHNPVTSSHNPVTSSHNPGTSLHNLVTSLHNPATSSQNSVICIDDDSDEAVKKLISKEPDPYFHKMQYDQNGWARFWLRKFHSYLESRSVVLGLCKDRQSNASCRERLVRLCNKTGSYNPWNTTLYQQIVISTPDISINEGSRPIAEVFMEKSDPDHCMSDGNNHSQAPHTHNLDKTAVESSNSSGVPVSATSLYMAEVQTLKELFHSDSADIKLEDLSIFTQCSADTLQDICVAMELSSLSDSSLATVAMAIASLKENLPLSHAAVLAEHCLKDKMSSVTGGGSRQLHHACASFIQTYPTALINTIILPALDHVTSNEMVIKLIRDILSNEDKATLLRFYIEKEDILSGPMIQVVKHVIESKVVLNGGTLSGLVRLLNSSSMHHQTDLQFGKLVHGLVKQYSIQLCVEDVSQLKQVMSSHGTFLKKSTLNLLNKLHMS